jgi:hypothetical protein
VYDMNERNGITHERVGRLLAGLTMLSAVFLAWLHHPAWLLAVAGTGLNLAMSGITDRCAVKSLLMRLGLPGERDLGRAEMLAGLAEKGNNDAGTQGEDLPRHGSRMAADPRRVREDGLRGAAAGPVAAAFRSGRN